MNRTITFRPSGDSLVREWSRFVLANSGGQIVNLTAYSIVVFAMGSAWIGPGLGTAIGSVAGLGVNFLTSRNLVFAPRSKG